MKKIRTKLYVLKTTFVYGKYAVIAEGTILENCVFEGSSKERIHIGKNCRLKNCKFILEKGNNIIKIGDNCRLDGAEIVCENGTVFVGKDTTCGESQFIAREYTSIHIGNDCMLSYNIKVFSTDGHPIYDSLGNRLNEGRDINIGNHVWIGNSVIILKGAKVPNSSIIGGGSIYSSTNNEESCIYVGNPAKCIKHDIRWERK